MKKKLRIIATLVAAIIIANSLLLLGKTEAATTSTFDIGYSYVQDGEFAVLQLYRVVNGQRSGSIGLRGDSREITEESSYVETEEERNWIEARIAESGAIADRKTKVLKNGRQGTNVNVRDAAKIAYNNAHSQEQKWWADANMDGKVDVRDASWIANMLANDQTGLNYNSYLQKKKNDGSTDDDAKIYASMAYPIEVADNADFALVNGTGAAEKSYSLYVKSKNTTITIHEGAFLDQEGNPNKEITIPIAPKTPTGTDEQKGNGTDEQKGNGTDDQKGNGTGEPTKTLTGTPASDKFEVTKIDTNQRSDGNYDVVVHTNKELDPDKLPDGWKLCDDKKSVTKVMAPGAKEDITLVAKTGEKANASVSVPEDKKKDDLANKIIAKTGESSLIIGAIAIVAIAGTVFYIKSK